MKVNVDYGEYSMWRYTEHLPLLESSSRISMGEGWTPMLNASKYAESIGCMQVLIKDESQNPTGTFKDRSASYTISWLREGGYKGIVLNSTGNASAAFATYAARAGMRCVSVVPEDVLEQNLLQMRLAGAEVKTLSDWSTAKLTTQRLAADTGYMDVSAGRVFTRGKAKQTLGFEIVEQLGWRFPEVFICPTGGGIALLAVQAAFDWLSTQGVVSGSVPRLFASQFSGCAPIARASMEGRKAVEPWEVVSTPRGGMRTPSPVLGDTVLKAVSAGGALSAETEEAVASVKRLAGLDGILVGLETGTSLAVLERLIACGRVPKSSCIVVLNTSTALKSDPAYLNHSALS